MSEIELKACPFCGSGNIDARGWASTESAGPACDDCGAGAGGVHSSPEENIRHWNTRASQWQPIESAPKDGTAILACYAPHYEKNGFLPIAVRWRAYHPNARGNEEWRDHSGAKVRAITHWQPLPAPPEVE